MDTHVDVHGGGRGPHLLLVHGFLSSRGQWAPNLKGLAEVCTPVTLELLGHGRSASPDDPAAYTAAAYVDRFEALRRELGAERWFVCGQSFGAGLTIRYAMEHPERIAGQVFTNSMSGLSPPYADDPKTRNERADHLRQGGHAALQAMPLYPKPSRRLAEAIWRELVDDAVLLSPVGVAETIRTTVPELSVAADLGRITVPSLLVNGRREAAFQPLRELAARQIADLTIADLDGGHAVNLDCPEAFNAAVADFVSRRWAS
jgi:2-succinyl-6-hydroxy-2,4-cyclohexadiene-1-carboxylate synthase